MIPRGEKGSVLIASLCAVSVFAVFISGLASQAGPQAELLKRETSAFEGRADFLSGMQAAGHAILGDTDAAMDSPADEWYGEIEVPAPWGARLTVKVEDEEARIDINKAPGILLETIFEKIDEETKLKGEAEDFKDALLERRGEGALLSLEELLLLEDIEKEDLEALRPYLTVHTGMSGVNINTAPPVVLEAFIEALPGDAFAKENLLEAILDLRSHAGTEPFRAFFTAEELDPEVFMAKLRVTPSVQMVQIVQQLTARVTADAKTWRVTLRSEKGRTAEAVIAENSALGNFRTLSWRES